jgi:hypothetical protein
VKHRFGLARFWSSTLLGVEPWLVLSFIAYIVAYLAYLGWGKLPYQIGQVRRYSREKLFGISGGFKPVN